VIPNGGGGPVGRLHVAVEPVYRSADDAPMFALTPTARGRPLSDGVNGVLEFLGLGREWIARTFASITTPGMRALWRRRRRPLHKCLMTPYSRRGNERFAPHPESLGEAARRPERR
jgi:hypothetical protein